MTSLLAFLFVIGVLVFFHELGHFLVAKWCGVRVEKFSLGFGKRLVGFTRGETEYIICALPLGGYVKMYGEGSEENVIVDIVEGGSNAFNKGFQSGDRIIKVEEIDLKNTSTWSQLLFKLKSLPDKQRSYEVERDGNKILILAGTDDLEGITGFTEKEYPRGFSNKSILSRFLIVIAGPLMNFILPFFFLPLVFIVGIQVPAYLEKAPEIGYVSPDSPAAEAGFKVNDKIISIEGKKIKDWRGANIAFQSNPDATLDVEVERNNQLKNLKLSTIATQDGIVAVGLAEPIPAKIGSVIPGSPAQKAGMQKGDQILEINNEKISDWENMANVIRANADKPISIEVNREGKILDFQATPEINPQTNQGAIGITLFREEITKKYGFIESVTKGVVEAANMIIEVTVIFFGFLFKLFTGKIALSTAGKSIAGPLFIAKISGTAAQSGLGQLLQFTSFISINLAIINLLPIPMLDGGHILFLLLEKIKGKSLSNKTLEITQRVGFTVLIFIMFLAVYNDFLRLKGDIFGWFGKLMQMF
ncbi:MAG: RIP metalloprotease RseP [Thermodesulfobacteriota bacterium]